MSLAKEYLATVIKRLKYYKDLGEKIVVSACGDPSLGSWRWEATKPELLFKGLAGAFDQRATALTNSMWVWVLWLACALVAGGYISAGRLDTLTKALSSGNPQWGIIAIELVLSVLCLGGPVWFASIATKQIGQRFQ